MKKELHPDLNETVIKCACGAKYQTKSVQDSINVEVCSSCHPFYTGKQRKAAKGGRIERFNKKYGLSSKAEEE